MHVSITINTYIYIGIISSGLEVSYAYKRREIKLGKGILDCLAKMLVYIYYTILYYSAHCLYITPYLILLCGGV